MKTYRQMISTLNECLKKNMWKSLFAFLLMSILEFVVMAVFFIPTSQLINAENSILLMIILVFLSFFCGFTIIMILQYGYHILLLRLLRGEFVTLGFLFLGFRNKKRVSKIAGIFALGLILAFAVCQFFLVGVKVFYKEQLRSISLPYLAAIVFVIYAFICVFILLRFIFAFVYSYDNPQLKTISVFKQSAKLLKNRCIRFIGFVLYAGGKHLIVAIGIYIAMLFVPTKLNSFASFLVSVIEFVYFIAAYTSVVRMFMAIPLFYLNALESSAKPTSILLGEVFKLENHVCEQSATCEVANDEKSSQMTDVQSTENSTTGENVVPNVVEIAEQAQTNKVSHNTTSELDATDASQESTEL